MSFNIKIICTICCCQRRITQTKHTTVNERYFLVRIIPSLLEIRRMGGGLSELVETQTPNTEAHSSDGENGSSASELRKGSGASSSKTPEGGVECDLFPALSGRGPGSRISFADPLKEAAITQKTANNIDSTLCHQKKFKMLTQTP